MKTANKAINDSLRAFAQELGRRGGLANTPAQRQMRLDNIRRCNELRKMRGKS